MYPFKFKPINIEFRAKSRDFFYCKKSGDLNVEPSLVFISITSESQFSRLYLSSTSNLNIFNFESILCEQSGLEFCEV